jgi:hypothetical protein
MSMKTRLAVLEAANYERELDLYSRFLAERHCVSAVQARQEIKEILARRQAEGRELSPEELRGAEELRQEVEQWGRSRD